MIVRELVTKISLLTDEVAFNQVEDRLQILVSKMGDLGRKASLFLSLPLAFAGKSMMQTGADVERKFAILKGQLNDSKNDIAILRGYADKVAVEYGRSASEVLDAMIDMAKNGKNAAEITSFIGPVIQAATVAQMGLAEASSQVSSTIATFKLQAQDAASVVDKLAYAADATQTDVGQLGTAMSYTGAFAKAFGMSLDETLAALGAMSNMDKELVSERGGTGLRATLDALINPSAQARKELDKLGISTKDSQGNFRKLQDIMQDFANLQGSDTSITESITKIFGSVAMPTLLALRSGYQQIGTLTKEIENSAGTGQRTTGIFLKTFLGSMEKLSAAWEKLKGNLANSGLLQIFTVLVDVLRWVIDVLGNLPKPILFVVNLIGVFLFLIGPLIALLSFLLTVFLKYRMISIIFPYLSHLLKIIPMIGTAFAWMGGILIKSASIFTFLKTTLGFLGVGFKAFAAVLRGVMNVTVMWNAVSSASLLTIGLWVAGVAALALVFYGLYGLFTGEENFMSRFFMDAWEWIMKCWQTAKDFVGLFGKITGWWGGSNASVANVNNTSSPSSAVRPSAVAGAPSQNLNVTTTQNIQVPPGTQEQQIKAVSDAVRKSNEISAERSYRYVMTNNPALE